jgi:hypothetical protein
MSTASDWLALAAAPSFAGMALLTEIDGATDMLCAGRTSTLGGMGLMYLLMSAFHLAPWLRLIGRPDVDHPISRTEAP